jgi:hypothetical protein
MNWDLQWKRVHGKYLGEFPISGVVESSRVKYGGTVSHTVILDNPIVVFGATRNRVNVNDSEIIVENDLSEMES